MLNIFLIGRAVIKNFKDSWKIVSIDIKENQDSNANIILENTDYEKLLPSIYKKISQVSEKYDSIMCVAGSWCGGSIKSPEIFSQIEKMNTVNLGTAVLS